MDEWFRQLTKNAPTWLTPEAVMIAAAVIGLLLVLLILRALTPRRPAAPTYVETPEVEARAVEPSVAHPAEVVADDAVIHAPAPEPVIVSEPEVVAEPSPVAVEAARPAPAPEPAAAPEPEPVAVPETEAEIVPEPAPVIAEPEPAVVVEPIAAEPAPEPNVAPEPDVGPEPVVAPEPSPVAVEAGPPAPASEPAPVAAPATGRADELTTLKGVGPRLADRLNAVGITSFGQIAALTAEEAADLDAKLGDFQGRMQRDRWIEQAGYLASGDIAGFEAVFGKL